MTAAVAPAAGDAVCTAKLPRIRHGEAMRLTAVENARLLDQLRALAPADWAAPTACAPWSVRDMVVHLIAAAEAQASPLEFTRQFLRGRRLTAEIGGHHFVDGMNEYQLRSRADWTADSLPQRWVVAAAAGLKARRRLPAPVRALPLVPLGENMGTDLGWKPLGYLMDMVYTRDVWMHRIDIADATSQPLVLTAEHDGRIVADLVAEWATLHDEPFTLVLGGPAGGTITARGGAAPLRLDAIEWARIISGRGRGDGILRHRLPL